MADFVTAEPPNETPSSGTGLATPEPVVNPETAPFWAAAAEHRLTLPRCNVCQEFYWYPRALCPRCHSLDTGWVEASGRGTVYSYTVVRKPAGAYAGGGPYALAFVELAEGPRIMTNVVPIEGLAIGAPVRVVFDDTAGGTALPRFRMTAATG
jgi:uncharacterized OB-fold protein